jgi:dGTPase
MSPQVEKAMGELRDFMFVHVYLCASKSDEAQAKEILRRLYLHYMEHPEKLSDKYQHLMATGDSTSRVVCDYIACMTDPYAIAKFQEHFVPKNWQL